MSILKVINKTGKELSLINENSSNEIKIEDNSGYLLGSAILGRLVNSNNISVEVDEILDVDVEDCNIKEITIYKHEDKYSHKIKIDCDRLAETGNRVIYKYIALRDEHSKYIADMIMNKGNSIRANNVFGFSDRLEGVSNCDVVCSPKHIDVECSKCKLNENGKCKRNLYCDNCIDSYICNRLTCKFKKDELIHDKTRMSCISDIKFSELHTKYMVCFSKNKAKESLIEKFCGRHGFILEYEVLGTSDSEVVDVVYSERPEVCWEHEVALANDVRIHGYNSKLTKQFLSFKHIDFSYEEEVRLIIHKNNKNNYVFTSEEELGIKLRRVTYVYDSYEQGFSIGAFDALTTIGEAILNRGVAFELNSTCDYVNNIYSNSNFCNDALCDEKNKEEFLKNIANKIRLGSIYKQ